MGRVIFEYDWSASGLSSVRAWPVHLKLAVEMVLSLPSAAILLWGPDFIQIYNDAYRDLMGRKHPDGLGQGVAASWPEVWDFVGPICHSVMREHKTHTFEDQRLVVDRRGMPEESFFRLSYSPVPGALPEDSGSRRAPPGGVLVMVAETTELVQARAREARQREEREALQKKRMDLFEELFRTSPSFLCVLRGPDFVFEFANDAYYQLVGQRELIGRPAFEAIPEAAGWGYEELLARVLSTGKPYMGFGLSAPFIKDPGQAAEEHFIDLIYQPLFDEDGVARRILCHGKDVTDHVRKRKQAEQALTESNEHFRRALGIDTVGVIFFDMRGRITDTNDAFLEMNDLSQRKGESGLQECNQPTPPHWREVILQAIDAFRETGCSDHYEKEFRRIDGSHWHALFAAKPLGEKWGVGYVLDITERVHAEQSLRESEARFRAMAEASPALVWQVNEEGNVVYLNPRCTEILGKSTKELLGSGWRSVIHPNDTCAYLVAVEQAFRERSRLQHRFRVHTAEGDWRWLESYALPWFSASNEYAGHVGMSVDITDRVNAETALLEADRRKDEFLATLAHELRNPLAPIANALALVSRPEGAAAFPRLLPVINRQVDSMVRLVDDLLEISRITSGKIELRRAPLDVSAALRNAVEAGKAQIEEKEQELSVSLPDAPLIVDADAVRLEQIFTNLLNNAVRYTPQGGKIWLAADRQNGMAIISVQDNGMGILPGMLPRLFDMFTQERRKGIGTQEGLGIGLSLVERLVEMHGGSVEARSGGQDQGSEFIVRLPLSTAAAQEQAPPAIPGETPGEEKAAPARQPLRVLVVDDNRDAAEVLCMLLQTLDMEVKAVHSGPDALAEIPDFRPDAILMDIGMPGMDGHEVARRIREQPRFDAIKLIALTGWGQEQDRRQSRESGFDHHLTKPVDFAVLKDLLAAL